MGYQVTKKSINSKIKIIRQNIDEEELWRRYIPQFKKVKKLFISPLRPDTKPSCIVNLLNGRLIYNDFGSDDSGDIFTIASKLWNLSLVETVDKIIEDYNLDNKDNRFNNLNLSTLNNKIVLEEKKSPPLIEVEIRKWQHKDKFYWESTYGITFKELKDNQIFPIGYFKIIYPDTSTVHQFNDQLNTLIYGLRLTDDEGKIIGWKIYQPLNKDYRFLSNIPWSLVEWDVNKEKENKDKSLIITKSRKDKIIIDKIIDKSVVDIAVVQSERETNLDLDLKDYKTILIIFDNDSTGIEYSTRLKKRLGENCTNLSSLLEYKDSGDYSKNKQLIRLKNLIDGYL